MAIGQELLNVPMGDMIRQMAFAIADAQVQLDESSLRVAEMMSGRRIERDTAGNATGTPVDTTILFDGVSDRDVFIRVTAYDSEGEEIARSPLVRVPPR